MTVGAHRVSTAIAGEESRTAWERYLANRHDRHLSHLWCWREIFRHHYAQLPEYLLATRNEEVVGVLPLVHVESRLFGRSSMSLPYHWSGGVLADDNESRTALLEAALSAATRVGSSRLVLRGGDPPVGSFVSDDSKMTFHRTLTDPPNDMFSSLRKQNRTRIRRAVREGVAVRFGIDRVGDFYGLYRDTMHRLGTPTDAFALFESVIDVLTDEVGCAVAYIGNRPVAAKLYIDELGTRHFVWGANDPRHRLSSANVLLMWRCIEDAWEKGLRRLDLGRSASGSTQARTKAEWGCEPSLLTYYARGLGTRGASPRRSNARLEMASRAWRGLPSFVVNSLGPRLAKHIP